MNFGSSSGFIHNLASNGWIVHHNFDLRSGLQDVTFWYGTDHDHSTRRIQLVVAPVGHNRPANNQTPTSGLPSGHYVLAEVSLPNSTGGWERVAPVYTDRIPFSNNIPEELTNGLVDLYVRWPGGGLNYMRSDLTLLEIIYEAEGFYAVTFDVEPGDAEIVIEDTDGFVFIVPQGESRVVQLPPGDYTYTVSKPEYESVTGKFSVVDSAVRVPESGSITLMPPVVAVPITSIRINAIAIETVRRGETRAFTVTLNEGATDEGIVWTTANRALATVDENGVVTINNVIGTVVLTATDPESSRSHSILLRIAS
jgi:hypothetical protein